MNLAVSNKVVLIAGSSRGIGKAIASEFLAEGAKVVITGRNGDSLKDAESDLNNTDGRLMAFTGDLSTPDDIQSVLAATQQRFGPVEIVVANIGSGRGEGGCTPALADWQRLLEVNLLGSAQLAQAVIPGMIEQKRGVILFMSSIAGVETSPAPLAYSCAKAALLQYTKNLAHRLASSNIRVNAIAPGNILFPGGSWEQHLHSRREEVERYIQSEVPMNRFGAAEEIASAAVFLCSPRASFITGACLIADGGQTRSL